MGKWLDKFSADTQESLPDIPDILPSVSGLSGPHIEVSAEITPNPPLQPGWLVAYRDRQGVLCGGCDDRQHGTVQACQWDGNGWTLWLTDGKRMPLSFIRSVGQTDDTGQIVAAWTVREHGYGGEGLARDNR